MRSSSTNNNSRYGISTSIARFIFSSIYLNLQLKISHFTLTIDIGTNRRTTSINSCLQRFSDTRKEVCYFFIGQTVCRSEWMDFSLVQSLIHIYISKPNQKVLVQ